MSEDSSQNAFNEPMRQARQGLWLEAAKLLQDSYKIFGIYIAISLFRRPQLAVKAVIAFLILTGGVFAYSWFLYRSVRFYIDYEKGEFIFSRGVFTKKKTVIQLARIQQVNLMQHVLQRLLNVYSVEVSTAGTDKTEVLIRAVSLRDAVELKKVLLSHRGTGAAVEETAEPSRESVLKLSNATILKVAITSRYGKSLVVLVAFWAAIFNQYSNFTGTGAQDDIPEVVLFRYLVNSTLLLTLAAILVWILFNIISGFVRYYNYRIRYKDGALQVEYGMIKTNQTIVRAEKVQMVEVVTNFFLRKMNLSRLIFKQASSDFQRDKKATVEIPGCNEREEKEFVSYALKNVPEKYTMLSPNYRKILKPVINMVIIPLPFVFMLRHHIPYFAWLFPVWAALFVVAGYFAYRHSKLLIADNYILLQEGIWDVSHTLMESYKIQGVKITQHLWHRRAGIAHVTLYTAADNLEFQYVNLKDINPYINKWMYDVESTSRSWM